MNHESSVTIATQREKAKCQRKWATQWFAKDQEIAEVEIVHTTCPPDHLDQVEEVEVEVEVAPPLPGELTDRFGF